MNLLYMLGVGGVEFWRCRIPALAIQKHGLANVRIIEKNFTSPSEIGADLQWADAVIVASPAGISSFVGLMKYRELGKKVFVDYDDYGFECSPFNPAYRTLGLQEVQSIDKSTGEKLTLWEDGKNGFDIKKNYKSQRALIDILNNVDLVTTTTPYLKDRYSEHMNNPEKIAVVPNAIDFERWKPLPGARDKYPEGFRIGYVCSASHAEDWMSVAPAIHYFLEKHPDAKLVVLGDVGFDLKGRFKEGQLEWYPFSNLMEGHYQYKVASLGLDVAIMPLAINEFNRCKSPLKFAEMTAFGYPVIAQNMHPYIEDIVSGENGMLAGSTSEWLSALDALYRSKELRTKLHTNALMTVKALYDIENVCKEWVRVFESTEKKCATSIYLPKQQHLADTKSGLVVPHQAKTQVIKPEHKGESL
jgi:hypothetical protein